LVLPSGPGCSCVGQPKRAYRRRAAWSRQRRSSSRSHCQASESEWEPAAPSPVSLAPEQSRGSGLSGGWPREASVRQAGPPTLSDEIPRPGPGRRASMRRLSERVQLARRNLPRSYPSVGTAGPARLSAAWPSAPGTKETPVRRRSRAPRHRAPTATNGDAATAVEEHGPCRRSAPRAGDGFARPSSARRGCTTCAPYRAPAASEGMPGSRTAEVSRVRVSSPTTPSAVRALRV